MSLLADRRDKGDLAGLKISDRKSLIYRLFADNAGFFLQNSQQEFEIARATIQVFENISGAFLNVAKSVIVPLVNPAARDWFASIGCVVLQPNETTKYLGFLIGYKVTPSQEAEFFLGKVQKCLSHWANRSLSFSGRTILLHHVIRAMPIYHLMSMSLNFQGLDDLECIARDFLLDKNEDGEARKALVSWKDIAHSR